MAQAPVPAAGTTERLTLATKVGDIPFQIDRPDDGGRHAAILLIHGGGFVFGSLDSHRSMARRLALASGMAVITLEYRLSPENPAPAAAEDCAAALITINANRSELNLTAAPITMMGDSAGGYLAVATAIRARHLGILIRQLSLLYPMLDPALSTASSQTMGDGYMLERDFLKWAWQSVAPDASPSMLFADPELATLPPTAIALAECDPLHDEGRAFVNRLRFLGVPVEERVFAGMIHGFAGLPQLTPTADQCLTWLAGRVRAATA